MKCYGGAAARFTASQKARRISRYARKRAKAPGGGFRLHTLEMRTWIPALLIQHSTAMRRRVAVAFFQR
jgi:hypothetical protein